MITEDEVERAVDYLRDNARRAAQAQANRIYCDEFRKSLKAKIMAEHKDLALGAQEREAYSDSRYTQHLEGLKQAVEEDAYHKFMLAAAEAKISAWQTQCRLQRAQESIR